MARDPFQRDGKGDWFTRWQNGRGTKVQTVRFEDKEMTRKAKELAEAMRHRITQEEVYKILLDLPDEPESLPEGTVLFSDYGVKWFKDRTDAEDCEPDTLAGYRSIYNNHLEPFFGLMAVPAIDAEARTKWIAEMKQKPAMRNGKPTGKTLSATTIKHAHALMHMMCDDAVPDHLSYNPFTQKRGRRKGNGLPKDLVPFEPVYLERWEAELIVRVCPNVIKPLVITALATGMRLGELIPLQVGDINLSGLVPTITIRRGLKRKGLVGAPKSKKSRRTVTISWALAMYLSGICQGKSKTALVFPSPMGSMWTESNLNSRYWHKALAAASFCSEHRPAPKLTKRGTELHDPYAWSTCDCPGRLQQKPRVHDLRHTHVGWLLDMGWDFHRIQLRLGHEKIETTINRYGPRKRDGLPEELASLDLATMPAVVAVEDLEDVEVNGEYESEEEEYTEQPSTEVNTGIGGVKITPLKLNASGEIDPNPEDIPDLESIDLLVAA